MSVLDRMVDRAYGALPSVAPLLRPGARPEGPAISVSKDDGFRIEQAERTSPSPEPGPRGPSALSASFGDRDPAMDGNRRGFAVSGKDSSDTERTFRPDSSRTDDLPPPQDHEGGSSRRTPVPKPAGTGVPGSLADGFARLSASPAPKGADTPELPVAAVFAEAPFETIPVRHRTPSRTTPDSDASRPSRSENVFADRRAARSEPEPPPEIHITIGRIELRGPRSEPKPAPAFRPRVSLDELLGRASGGGR